MDWIDVNDSLPDDKDWVLILSSELLNGRIVSYSMFTASYVANTWIKHPNDKFHEWETVTHWMPLPEPPKEADSEKRD